MLSIAYSILYSLLQPKKNENVAIKVYKERDSNLIWQDKGSGANRDISTHRPKGAGGFSVGDIALGRYRSPRVSLVVKAVKNDALAFPVDFRCRWNNRGSGASWDGSFWEPVCPGSYVPLGHVSVRHHGRPSLTDVVCIKNSYVVEGNWVYVWNNRGSGAREDVTVYEAVPRDSNGQGMRAMGAVAHHGPMDRPAYVLKSSIVQYIQGKPATKYILQNVQYLFYYRNILSNTPEQLARTIAENRGSSEQTVTRSISYTYEQTNDWSISIGESGIETTVIAGIPDVASGSVSMIFAKSYKIFRLFL